MNLDRVFTALLIIIMLLMILVYQSHITKLKVSDIKYILDHYEFDVKP